MKHVEDTPNSSDRWEYIETFIDIDKGYQSEFRLITSAAWELFTRMLKLGLGRVVINRKVTIGGMLFVACLVVFLIVWQVGSLFISELDLSQISTPIRIVFMPSSTPTICKGSPTVHDTTTAQPLVIKNTLAPVTPSPIKILNLTGCVSTKSLRVRSGPGTIYSLVTGLTFGECLGFSGRSNDSQWLFFSTPGLNGWVFSDYIELEGDILHIPVKTITDSD